MKVSTIIKSQNIPDDEPQGSVFIFIITNEPIDLRHFQTLPHTGRANDTESQLGLLAWRLRSGNRPVEADVRPRRIEYDVRRVLYTYFST